eukprot:3060454-Prymnesium_polylepis.1
MKDCTGLITEARRALRAGSETSMTAGRLKCVACSRAEPPSSCVRLPRERRGSCVCARIFLRKFIGTTRYAGRTARRGRGCVCRVWDTRARRPRPPSPAPLL